MNNLIWVEKYRPKNLYELCVDKYITSSIQKHLNNPKIIPSFIFTSSKPGTGKTSTALILANILNCDLLKINASDERGIDTVRAKVKVFITLMSANPDTKKCVFLDEADGLTKQAQESMKSLMELHSRNSFFILSCNDIAKIIEPIRSRCVQFNFDKPPKDEIIVRLQSIIRNEGISSDKNELEFLVNNLYPDIRTMIMHLQSGQKINDFKEFSQLIKQGDYTEIYKYIKEKNLNKRAFVRYYFDRLFNVKKLDKSKILKIALHLADIEKNWTIGVHEDINFLANIMTISKVLND